MRIASVTGIIFTILALAVTSGAADNPTVSLEVDSQPIALAMSDLSKQAGVQIACEPGIKAEITGHFRSIELEKLLDTLTKTNDLKWLKLYVPSQGEEASKMDQIKARADAVAAVTGGPIGVYDPATGKEKLLVEQAPSAPAIETEKLGLKSIYYIFKPKVEAPVAPAAEKDAASRYVALEAERTRMLAQMTPEQQIAAKQQEMAMMLQFTPEARQQMMLAEMRAHANMDPAMREQLHQARHDTVDALRAQGLMPDRGRGGPRGDWGGRRPDQTGTNTDRHGRRGS